MCLIAAGCALISSCGLNAQAAAAASPGSSGSAPQAPVSAAQASAAGRALPAWDVATIKPAATNAMGSMLWFTPDGIKITNVPLTMIVREAFGLEQDHIIAGPGVAKMDRNFDIEAKVAPEDAPKLKDMKLDQRRPMLVALLEERFGLKYHHETRDLPEYELTVTRGGVKMTASKLDVPDAEGHTQGQHMLMMHGRGHIESTGTGMPSLAHILSGQLGRTVVDKTGLTGNYDYKLDWTPDDGMPAMTKGGSPDASGAAATPDASGPSLFTAIQEQLGLKLEATKGPADVVVVDQLEQPTAN